MIDKKIGYRFKDQKLLKTALTHPSKSKDNYQRLEFLGDSILNFLVGEYLFKNCDKSEGEFTVLRAHFVAEDHLAQCFDEMELFENANLKVTKAYEDDSIYYLVIENI